MPDPTQDQVTAGPSLLLPEEAAVLTTVRKMLAEPGSGFTHSRRYAVLVRAVDWLAAGLDVVFKAHRPVVGEDGRDRCAWCRLPSGRREKWPCGEYLNVSRELLGGE